MKENINIGKRRKFLKFSALGGFSAMIAATFSFKKSLSFFQAKNENQSLKIKINPLAVKRNKKG